MGLRLVIGTLSSPHELLLKPFFLPAEDIALSSHFAFTPRSPHHSCLGAAANRRTDFPSYKLDSGSGNFVKFCFCA
jgi:hypothetical protein